MITTQRSADRPAGTGAGRSENHGWLLPPPRKRPNVALVRWAISREEGQLLCAHIPMMRVPHFEPKAYVCRDCLARGITWRGLRLCRSCGHIGCCENSRQRHADSHFWMTGHPIVDALGPNRVWSFCYIDHTRFFS